MNHVLTCYKSDKCHQVVCDYEETRDNVELTLKPDFCQPFKIDLHDMADKICIKELWFLYTALPLIEVYLLIKLHVETCNSFCVMIWPKFKYEK